MHFLDPLPSHTLYHLYQIIFNQDDVKKILHDLSHNITLNKDDDLERPPSFQTKEGVTNDDIFGFSL